MPVFYWFIIIGLVIFAGIEVAAMLEHRYERQLQNLHTNTTTFHLDTTISKTIKTEHVDTSVASFEKQLKTGSATGQ